MNKAAIHPEPKKYKPPKGPKPIPRKNKNTIGLGRTIANQRRLENDIQFLPDGEMRFTTDKKEAEHVKLQSKTQENSLDEFLSTAQLADTDFTADKKLQIKIIKVGNSSIVSQSGLLSPEEMEQLRIKHQIFENKLIIPKRPKWDRSQTRMQIERQENLAFLDWRRDLAHLTENNDLILTPFERNIEVWRQLWRVVERSDLVVQIADARNPLLFRSVDLESYVQSLSRPEENQEKTNLLLINKSDMLSKYQRAEWAKYFISQNINFVFFSAARANELLEQENEQIEKAIHHYSNENTAVNDLTNDNDHDNEIIDKQLLSKIKILTIDELENLFIEKAPKFQYDPNRPDRKIQIGLVGYPNVGKSSTINALVGSKKVSVSATPGKTKHFQTIHLTKDILLCDCPGLVFPNFAYTNGDLVCNGVLPIDQLREHIPPSSIVCQRIPKYYLEAIYGIHINIKKVEDGGNGEYPTAHELLNAYARSKGYMTQGFGTADEPRAARYILKDYINGKLLFVNPPPVKLNDKEWTIPSVEEQREFNKELYKLSTLPETRQKQIRQAMANKNLDIDEFDLARDLSKLNFSMHIGESNDSSHPSTRFYGGRQAALESAGDDLDNEFFNMNNVKGKVAGPFHKQQVEGSGNKKHNKKNKKNQKKTRVVNY